jgi:hypothetical protein
VTVVRDVLEEWEAERRRRREPAPTVRVAPGDTVRHRGSRFLGRVVRMTAGTVELRDDRGILQTFQLADGAFEVAGQTVSIARAASQTSAGPTRTASGSVAAASGAPARVARASRLLVEGVHDAELVEKVWGDDLRSEGVVVERLDGLDHLDGWLREFRPDVHRRVGVLVDHLVPGSKEARLVADIAWPGVLVTGTPFVDVWQAVRPHVVGIDRWPSIPKGVDWKSAMAAHLGTGDVRSTWKRIVGAVSTYADLEPELNGAVERLIDFVLDTPTT